MPIQRIELNPSITVPYARVEIIAAKIASGSYYGKVKNTTLNPDDSVGKSFSLLGEVKEHKIKAKHDGNGTYTMSELTETPGGLGQYIKTNEEVVEINSNTKPIPIFDSKGDRMVKLYEVYCYVAG